MVFPVSRRLCLLVVLGVMACSACASTPSPSESAAASAQACDARDLRLSPGREGVATGTSYVALHVDLVFGSACLIPSGPAVALVDAAGRPLAAAPATPGPDLVLANRTDFEFGWSSWCEAPPAAPLHVRLDLPGGALDTPLPEGFAASCMQVPTVVHIEAVQP